jgi:hypothetical protein
MMRKPKLQPVVTFTLLPYTSSAQQEAAWLELWDRICQQNPQNDSHARPLDIATTKDEPLRSGVSRLSNIESQVPQSGLEQRRIRK